MNDSLKINVTCFLTLTMKDHHIDIESSDEHIKCTFNSIGSVISFIRSYRILNDYLKEECFSHLYVSYYLKDTLIGESNPHLPLSWIGSFFGRERTKIYPGRIFRYLFKVR